MIPPGQFITMEGVEGAGKSTALNYVAAQIKKQQPAVLVTREPGGTPLAEDIRQTLLHRVTDEKMCWETELLLMFAARAQHIHALIKPALAAGTWVLSDRFVDASFAYQGGGRHIPMEKIQLLSDWIVTNTMPHLTFLLDIDPALGLQRAASRGQGKDRIEQEKIDFFIQAREVYLARAKAYPDRIKIIDASQSLPAVQEQIQHELNLFLKRIA